MSGYDFLKKYIPGGDGINDNWFKPIKCLDIKLAEEKMHRGFPSELKEFYMEIGVGMLRSPHNIPDGYEFYSYNRILPPMIAVDYMLGILQHPELNDYYMAESFYEDLPPGHLPFFEIGDSCRYLTMKLDSDNPNAVWDDFGEVKIENSFEKFIWRLYYESPWFYDDIIEKFYKNYIGK